MRSCDALYGRAGRTAQRLELEREPVRHDLRTGVAFERRHAPGRPPKTRGPCGRRRTPSQAAEQRLQVGVGQAPLVRAGKQDAKVTKQRRERPQPARQLVAIVPRRARSAALALSSRRRGSVDAADALQQPGGGVARRRRNPRSRRPVPRRRCHRRPRPRRAPRLRRTRARASAPPRCPRRRAGRTAAAGSATGRSAAARPGREVTSTKIEADGGSSSVFSSAFCASTSSASASSTMTTRRRPSNGR